MNHKETILPDWKWGTAEGSREFDRRLDARLTFREKLEWLEEAETLSLRLRGKLTSNPAAQPEALNDARIKRKGQKAKSRRQK